MNRLCFAWTLAFLAMLAVMISFSHNSIRFSTAFTMAMVFLGAAVATWKGE